LRADKTKSLFIMCGSAVMGRIQAVILYSSILLLADSVSIHDITSPAMVEVGKELILDCDFTYSEEEKDQLVVKWFFNGSRHPFYQWVPALDFGPQIISTEFTESVDLSYTIEGGDKYSQFRALHIPSVQLDLAGQYTCQVSSFTGEDAMTKEVSLFAPPSSMSVTTSSSVTSELVTISCTAMEVFPAPIMSLSWTQHLETHTTDIPAIITEEDGMFSAFMTVSIPRDSVGNEDVCSCLLSIPGTNFQRNEETEMFEEYIPEKFLEMFTKDDVKNKTDDGDIILTSDYDQDLEEPVIALERSPLPLEQTLTHNDAQRRWPGIILLGMSLFYSYLRY